MAPENDEIDWDKIMADADDYAEDDLEEYEFEELYDEDFEDEEDLDFDEDFLEEDDE